MTRQDSLGSMSGVRVAAGDRTIGAAIRAQARVVGACVMRDMRTRYGGSLASYLLSVAWPFTHLLVILFVYLISGRSASYGTDLLLWTASGAIPFILYYYPTRWLIVSRTDNAGLLSFPAVLPIDLVISRIIVELMTALIVVATIFAMISFHLGDEAHFDLPVLIQAFLASFYFGVSLGVLGAPLVFLSRAFVPAFMLLAILIWVLGGIAFLPDSIPQPYRDYLALNPFIHCAEWFRMGLYEDYNSETLNREYLLMTSTGLLCIGLILDRLVRK